MPDVDACRSRVFRRNPRFEEVLRPSGGRWARPRHPRRRILHPARPERRRQDHHLAHGGGPAEARCGVDLRPRHRRTGRSRRGQAGDGLDLRRADDLRQADAVRISRIRRRALGHRRRARRSPRARPDRLARPRSPCPSALRGLLQGHAPEGGAGGRARARAEDHHPRRALHRARCRLRPAGQDRAARARRRRRHRDHDHAHSRSRRAHGRSDRRHRAGAADRAGHPRRAAPAGRQRQLEPAGFSSLEDTFLALVAEEAEAA